jgi:hypothetical protein
MTFLMVSAWFQAGSSLLIGFLLVSVEPSRLCFIVSLVYLEIIVMISTSLSSVGGSAVPLPRSAFSAPKGQARPALVQTLKPCAADTFTPTATPRPNAFGGHEGLVTEEEIIADAKRVAHFIGIKPDNLIDLGQLRLSAENLLFHRALAQGTGNEAHAASIDKRLQTTLDMYAAKQRALQQEMPNI